MKLSKEQLKQIIKEELEQIVSENKDSDFSDLEQKVIAYIKGNPEKLKQLNVDPREVDRSLGYENEDFLRLAKMLNIPNIDFAKLTSQMLVKKINNTFKQYTDGYIGYEDARGDIELIAGDPAFKDEKQIIKTALNGLDSKAKARGDLDSEEDIEFEPMMENEEESSLEKILKILDSAEGGLRFSDIVKQAGMPKKDVVDIYYDYEELFQQIWDGGTKYKLSKRGQEALNPPDDDEQYRKGLQGQAALGLGSSFFEHKGHEGGLKLTKEQLTKIVIEEIEKAKTRLIDRALEVEKKGHKGSEMSAEKEAKFKSWASKQSEEALRDYINKHK